MKRLTKIISIILAALMLMSVSAVATTASGEAIDVFTDLKKDVWYYESVAAAYELKLMQGGVIANGCIVEFVFSPDDQLTREQFVTILMRTVAHNPRYGVDPLNENWKTIYDYTSKFSDVDRLEWYGSALMWAENFEVTNGVTDSLFGVGRTITREEMATLIYRYMSRLKLAAVDDAENVPECFGDEDEISEWAVEAVDYVRRTGIITGDGNGNFRPQDNATRAEAAAIFVRLFYAAELDLNKVFDESNVERIVFTTRDESNDGLLRTFTLEGEKAKEAVRYFRVEPLASQYSSPSVGIKEKFELYDKDGKIICSFNFTRTSILINGYRSYNYEKDYFVEYYERLCNS